GDYLNSACESPEDRIISYVRFADYLLPETGESMAAAHAARTRIGTEELAYLSAAWKTFTATSPEGLPAYFHQDASPFDNLPQALRRLCQEYPAVGTRLTLTESRIIASLNADNHVTPGELFKTCRNAEEIPFLGDWSFWQYLRRLSSGPEPLLEVEGNTQFNLPRAFPDADFNGQRLQLTAHGSRIANGDDPWDRPQTWIGGVLVSSSNDWRWDDQNERFVIR
ncbi:MAG: hypothetical protein HKN13_07940, partial [Rhodothermales bacterium]|nr:hypothetical protein [Rhodothermales bacterium]